MTPDQHVLKIDTPAPEPERGIFETLLVISGRPVELDLHLARLAQSLEDLYGQEPPPDARDLVSTAAAGTELGRLRLDVSPRDGNGVRVADVDPALVFPGFGEAPDLQPVEVPGWRGAHKWADRRLLERAEAESGDGVPLLLDGGLVLETSRGNLFAAVGGALVTPPADGRILPGVTRALAIETARAAGIEVREEELSLDRLREADEVFTTGAVRGIEPVRAVRGVRDWHEGAITPRVASGLRARWFG
ncbi:MAG: aminotransferase class IV [Thermoleophilaceae bacterium]|nr:aminotransferase class IV [Thermoleophilaceae bacterium]